VAEVSLDGLEVMISHALDLEEAGRRIEGAARDLGEGSLKKHELELHSPAPDVVILRGKREGSHFEAEIKIAARAIVVSIRGSLVLSQIVVTLAGGQSGVRRRVRDEVENALRDRLVA
jgi:hypothetical protein